ncbi:MAG TPA: Xaa-Pro aminopeptidase [Clostridiales bacterium]|nr:MAG: hypothetical protein A2Y18_02405 [Clostridiales bacterium GWD2_32_19]HCC07549.1 Xaa-Pro aminopeptidase [Clostridiales bacterium]
MNKEFFINNRKKLIDGLPDNSILILYSGSAEYWSGDESHKFSISKDFYYITGLEEENYIYFYQKSINPLEVLFIEKDNDEKFIKFFGHKKSKEEVYQTTDIENIDYTDEFEAFFEAFIENSKYTSIIDIYLDMINSNSNFNIKLQQIMNKLLNNINYHNIDIDFSNLRAIKQEGEIRNIKKAIDITHKGIQHIFKNAKNCKYENEIEALYDYEIKVEGIYEKAFHSIVASGENAAILHYSKNNSKMCKDDLVLLDLGVRYENYCSDISRTFPLNGYFNDRQKVLYNIVLNTQIETMNSVKVGMTFKELNNVTKNSLIRQLKEINLIDKDEEVEKYYYHSVSHPLGLDTHDCRGHTQKIAEGMVITIEPGLYIEEESIGIRIEDDILVTKDGYINLSENIPKEIEDIEKIMRNS